VNHSRYHTRLIDRDIYLGFVHLKDLSKDLAQAIAPERQRRGPFRDLADFVRRLPASKEQLTILIRIGAFAFTGQNKPELLWDLLLCQAPGGQASQADILFPPPAVPRQLPKLTTSILTMPTTRWNCWVFPWSRLSTCCNTAPPTSSAWPIFRSMSTPHIRILGYLVCIKQTTTIHQERMQFANFIDPEGVMFDVVRFPPVVKRYPLAGAGVYLIEGRLVKEFGAYSIENSKAQKLVYELDPRLGKGRL
jgi:DNA polymerase III alpha subunit